MLYHLSRLANPPNLIVSSRLADEKLWTEVLDSGGYDVLPTPFDPTEVSRVTTAALAAWKNRIETALHVAAASAA
jgi:DNA-binding response OmpR family regulator